MVSFVEVAGTGGIIFGVGVVLGMFLYRLLWHVDTVALRAQIEGLQNTNDVLREQIVQIGSELYQVREQLAEVEAAARYYQEEFNIMLRRG